MGEAKRRKQEQEQSGWPVAESYRGTVDLYWLPPVPDINGARLRALTGDDSIRDDLQIRLNAFRAVAGEKTFHVGFCLGNGEEFSAVGIAVIDRLGREVGGAPLHVVPVVHEDIAWDIVLRHLRTFSGRVLLFAFPDSDVYDAGTAEKFYSKDVRVFDEIGVQLEKLTAAQRRKVREQKAAILERPLPAFYAPSDLAQKDSPWIFGFRTPAGKLLRAAVWNGRRDYAHEMPDDILNWVGGEKIAIVQVEEPVGVNRRSSLQLTHLLAKDFDGVIHWARDTETFQSIVTSFVRLDLDSVGPLDLPKHWKPEVTILAASDNQVECVG